MNYLPRERWRLINWGGGSIAGGFLLLSVYVGIRGFYSELPQLGQRWPAIKIWQALFLLVWVCVPPAWFWFEYFFLFKRVPNAIPDDFEKFKYGQDLASKIWLAVISALLMLYFGKDLRH